MVEEPIAFHRALAASGAREQTEKPQTQTLARTRFDRLELNRILAIYGRMVAAGEWRDYALDFLDDVAVFSIFRRSRLSPAWRGLPRHGERHPEPMFR